MPIEREEGKELRIEAAKGDINIYIFCYCQGELKDDNNGTGHNNQIGNSGKKGITFVAALLSDQLLPNDTVYKGGCDFSNKMANP